jgi:hypothetical protein
MRILIGLELSGANSTGRAGLATGEGAIGSACWGPMELLRDLELRLGLSAVYQPNAVRIACFAARMAKLTDLGRFYSRSFAIDPLGTAKSVLALRDLLLSGGWNGRAIPQGGARLDALHELEHLEEPPLPAGDADRVAAVVAELARRSVSPYSELELVEAPEDWPACWQLVFRSLERAGTQLKRQNPPAPSAPADTDLGRLQRVLLGASDSKPIELRGDGSFVVLRAETSWEAARATAALLSRLPAEGTAVIRECDASALDNALATAGLRTQGLHSVSAWRSALQVLPLALELAFEPKDPYRVLELVTLPVGPFTGFVGHALARALAQSPGIGSPAWEDVKKQVPAREQTPGRAEEQLARIAEWLEEPGVDATDGAPIERLLAVTDRVRAWLVSLIPVAPEDALLLAAAQQAAVLRTALENDPRQSLTLVQVRKLAESVLASGTAAELLPENAGRASLVDTPDHLHGPCESLVWWSFTASPSASGQLPWRRHELGALAAAELRFPDPGRRLAERAAAARSAFCCARRRLVLVIPAEQAGHALSHHPLWDELLSRTGLDEVALVRVTLSTLELRDPDDTRLLRDRPLLSRREPVELPGGYFEWRVPPEQVGAIERFSPASLERLLGCPFEWVLHHRAGVHPGGNALPPLFLLSGSLGHRLVELLHGFGAFELEESALRLEAEARLQALFQREGAVLLRSGMGFERAQLERQLVGAVLELSRLLRDAGLRIVAVEKEIGASWQGGKLEGRLDLLVVTEDGQHAIIDMKGGMARYRDLLRSGTALQLAAYAFAQREEHDQEGWPDAGYFSLKHGKLFGLRSRTLPHAQVIDGPALSDTWQRIERSMERALPFAKQGKFAVTGIRGAAPLLESLGVPESASTAHFAIPSGSRCDYCRYDALCGRRWEALQ